MRARISGLGQWLPSEVRDNTAWPPEFVARSRASEQRELVDVAGSFASNADAIAARYFASEAADPFLGSTRRRIAPADMTAPAAEALAAEAALADAGVEAKDIDAVFSWAAVPERIVPPSAPQVAARIGATSAYAAGMDAGCATPLTQLEAAAALIESGRARHVLLTQSHLITRTFALMHPASPNVGDAATAMVVSAAERGLPLVTFARTHGEYYSSVTWCRGKESDPPWWEAGPAYYLGSQNRAQAQELMRGTVRFAAETIQELLRRSNVPLDEIDVLASVQPRRWVPAAIREALGMRAEAPQTFDELAHLGGCGVVTNLIQARAAELLTPGSKSVLYAQGAGFTRAAALVCW
ncbi:MAG: 3-oxoacyl-ACP synthase III family protein [Myxococcota bacterium]